MEDKMFYMTRAFDLFKEIQTRMQEIEPYMETLFDIIDSEKQLALKK